MDFYVYFPPKVYDALKREGKLPVNARRSGFLPTTKGPSYITTKI